MSVLIKGVKMPKSCGECIFEIFGGCHINLNTEPKNKLTHSCPLIELPDHGDLIDKDELYRKTAEWEEQARNQVNEGWTKWNIILTERTAFKFDVADAPVVIPAERSKDETD